MRRIDVIAITLAFGLTGLVAYGGLVAVGLPTDKAEIWTPVLLLAGLLGWLATYATRVITGKMTYHTQLEQYKTAVLEKKLAEMSAEEIAQLLQETECKE
ncbi:MAG: DUF3007 family protein [Pseudanabaenaceae cyanobacterium]